VPPILLASSFWEPQIMTACLTKSLLSIFITHIIQYELCEFNIFHYNCVTFVTFTVTFTYKHNSSCWQDTIFVVLLSQRNKQRSKIMATIKRTYQSTEDGSGVVVIINGVMSVIQDRRQFNRGALAAIQRKMPRRGRRSTDEQLAWLAGYRRLNDWVTASWVPHTLM
jgi:hypothetical protein